MTHSIKTLIAVFALSLSAGSFAQAATPYAPPERQIVVSVEAPASLEDAWRMWTTREGLQSFFAPEAHIDPRVGGNLSVYFFPDRPRGVRGAEDMRILAFETMKRLSFTWNAPVELPNARMQRSVVTIRFDEIAEDRTRVSLVHDHFGEGEEWDRTIDYFARAWSERVVPYFLYAAAHGRVEWGMQAAPVDVVAKK